jgi:hypothetical protein
MTGLSNGQPNEYWRPTPGEISPDRAAISGNMGFLDLFEGGNLYYRGYTGPHNRDASMVAVNTIASLRTTLTPSVRGLLYAVVPSKASCLPENYPIFLPNIPTSVFSEVRDYLQSISGNIFFDRMITADLQERQRRWLQTDSHWSAYGAYEAAAEILAVLGVPPPQIRMRSIEKGWGGDLCGRWKEKTLFALEDRELLLGHDEAREVKYDNGNGLTHSASIGRFIHWHNELAPIRMKLAIIGGSSSGIGKAPEQLTYWLSLIFSETYFLHSSNCPTDLIEKLSPDFVLIQTTERFLQFPYIQNLKLDELCNSFANRVSQSE